MLGVAIRNLSVDFATDQGVVHGLRDVSLSAAAGRIVGIVGESGSGKSTLGLTTLGLLANNARVTSGTLELAGDSFDLTRPGATAALRGTRIATIFQDPLASLNPVFCVRAHLYELLRRTAPAHPNSSWADVAEAALAAVGIDRPRLRLDQFPYELSGGMRQRVAIAMAFIVRPQLLIADEPTTALDVTVEAQVMREILKLRDAIGCTVLFISHSLGLVAQHCDDVFVIYAGEKVESGGTLDVIGGAGHPYTAALLACEVQIDQPRDAVAARNRFRIVPGDLPDPRQPLAGCIYRNRCGVAIPHCATLVPSGHAVGGNALHEARCHLLVPP